MSADPAIPFPSNKPRAVIIGSGFGGLAAAVRLGARGYDVTVLERLDRPGGRGRAYVQDGFTFDSGPTIITAPFLFEELWRLCGKTFSDDIDLRALDPYYRIVFDAGGHFDACADDAAMKQEIARISPEDVEGYTRFMQHSERLFRIGFEKFGHVPFDHLSQMIGIVPDLVRARADRSVYATVCDYVKHPHLRFALSYHPLFIGGNPFRASSIYCMISYFERHWGVHFAMGGTGALVKGLVGLIEGQGGVIRTKAEVAEITVENRRATGVRLASGETIAADIVVSNADTATTYAKLLAKAPRKCWTDRKLDRAAYSMSVFVWYFGTRRKYPRVQPHTILVGPRYGAHVADIFDRKVLAEDFSLYLYRPTAIDPSLAPEGCDTFYALSPVPHMDSGVDWSSKAEPYRQAIARRLSETLLPGLEDEVVTSRIFTPQNFQDVLQSRKGAAFGFEAALTQSAWFRPHNKSEDIERLYLVGAGTHPGAGVPTVLSSARVLDAVTPDPRSMLETC
ncbi:phytoene dehydrogenase [Rhodoblastus sphagnicola]|uniref:Phytoene dehydrogenase n=1 Tax=Rhodoblastus sphagnicola TaxID=333368 RepID=A0A2S6N7Z5_9HYPH|nr:phytoene desaturase [Rhodoblastus sphagnicola]MBB4197804.1 phytoene desaturase [Rhodoblastus sphagnicola]PPQ30729.1 phytoene dehydrogenase [Rhodoblastus sphagnicola]